MIQQVTTTATAGTVSVQVLPKVPLVTSPNQSVFVITQGDSVSVTASGADAYQWSHGPSTANVFLSNPGNYTVTGSRIGYCSVTSVSIPVVTFAPVCEGSTIFLSAPFLQRSESRYSWTGPGGYTGSSANSVVLRPNATSVMSGAYSLSVTIPDSFIAISAGGSHSLAIRADGTLWAWGANDSSQLGTGNQVSSNIPVQVGTSNNWLKISAGKEHSLGIQKDGTLWAWGANGPNPNHSHQSGRLGDGTATRRASPVQIGTSNEWVEISAGFLHSLGIQRDGTLWAWGANLNNQLGDRTGQMQHSPVRVGYDSNWSKVYANDYLTSYAIKQDGSLWSWGYCGDPGEHGVNRCHTVTGPGRVGTANDWVDLGAATEYCMAVKSNGTLWTWGTGNGYGGSGISGNVVVPTQVGTDSNWVSVEATGLITYARKANGEIFSMGWNEFGALGNGSVVPVPNVLARLEGNPSVRDMSVGSQFAVMLNQQGRLLTVGKNDIGQLGLGTMGPSQHSWNIYGSEYRMIQQVTTNATAATVSVQVKPVTPLQLSPLNPLFFVGPGDSITVTASGAADDGATESPTIARAAAVAIEIFLNEFIILLSLICLLCEHRNLV
jgi:alpha-tubulin suppressor-like RCC1 family protein